MKLAIMGKGAMGQLVYDLACGDCRFTKVDILEPIEGESLFELEERPDIIIDFSHPQVLEFIGAYLKRQDGQTGVVFATTGYTTEEEEILRSFGEYGPVIQSYNYSYGINTMKKILSMAVPLLEHRGDMEIIEKHHRNKVDAPSGTALMLATYCNPEGNRQLLCGRKGDHLLRQGEIGIHSIRGGSIFGEHTVLFALDNEVLEIRHTAFSKEIFAKGALDAALWLKGKKPGIYSVEEVFY